MLLRVLAVYVCVCVHGDDDDEVGDGGWMALNSFFFLDFLDFYLFNFSGNSERAGTLLDPFFLNFFFVELLLGSICPFFSVGYTRYPSLVLFLSLFSFLFSLLLLPLATYPIVVILTITIHHSPSPPFCPCSS